MKLLLPRLRPAALCGLLFLLLAGCESGPDRRAMEEARRAVPPMAASDTFFQGKVLAQLTLGNTAGERVPGKGPGGRGGKGGPSIGGSSMASASMGGGRHRGGGESMGGGEGRPEQYDADSSEELRPRYADSPMPPAMLRLRLENQSDATLTVEITDLDSELGNFATRPDKFTLEPGTVGEPGAMQSLLGVESLALPVKLTLRVAGKAETKTLVLRPVTPEAAPPKPAP